MSSVPYSRYLIYPVTWYSFLIAFGASLAVFIACREERYQKLPKDTIIDLALWIIPFGIFGARLYYVVFSWESFSRDLLSVFRIWEGGLAIYGGIIAGFIVLFVFSRKHRLPVLKICDLIAPGLVLAQSIGRWGNWFNMEAYGAAVTNPDLCFFPMAVQIPAENDTWHLATFFYESVWNLLVFVFLVLIRHKWLKKDGDVFFFYLFLYAAGRMIIEEMRVDSLYAVSSIRISQLLSILICTGVLIYYSNIRIKQIYQHPLHLLYLVILLFASVAALYYAVSGHAVLALSLKQKVYFLSAYSVIMLTGLFSVHFRYSIKECRNANNKE